MSYTSILKNATKITQKQTSKSSFLTLKKKTSEHAGKQTNQYPAGWYSAQTHVEDNFYSPYIWYLQTVGVRLVLTQAALQEAFVSPALTATHRKEQLHASSGRALKVAYNYSCDAGGVGFT